MTIAFIGAKPYHLLQPILSLKRKTRENLTTLCGSKKSKKSKFIGNGWCWYQRFQSEVRDRIDHKTQVFTHPKTSFSDHHKPAIGSFKHGNGSKLSTTKIWMIPY